MIKELVSLGKFAKKSGVFAGGVLFGSLGLKLLASKEAKHVYAKACLLYTSPSPRDRSLSRMPSSA